MIRKFTTLFIFAVFVWLIWSFSGRNTPLQESNSYLSVVEEVNPSDSLSNNILAIQPYMEVSDYFNQDIYKSKIRQYLVAASTKDFIDKNTLIIYPENVGTWLVLVGEKHSISEMKSLKKVMSTLALSNAFDFFLGFLKTGDEINTESSAIFRMKAKAMLEAYYMTFSEISEETGAYIIAGSIVLPAPSVVDGKIYVELNGPLYNASFLFGPDGNVIGEPILKPFPDSTIDVDSEKPRKPQVFELPFGKTSVAICKDSWHSQSYTNISGLSSGTVLVSSFCTGEHFAPSNEIEAAMESNSKNTDNLVKLESEKKHYLSSSTRNIKSNVAFNVFLHGDLWDLDLTGQPHAMLNNRLHPITHAEKGGVWSLNF